MKISKRGLNYNQYVTPNGTFTYLFEALKNNPNITRRQFYRKIQNDPQNYKIIPLEKINCTGCGTEINLKNKKKSYCSEKCKKLKFTYNINIIDFNNMLKIQKNACYICHTKFTKNLKPSKNSKNYPNVDHCHETGKVRGLLCLKCNRAIGLLCDNTNFLYRTIDYLSNRSIKISKIRDVITPIRSTIESAGIDFFIPNDFKETVLKSNEDIKIPSGIKVSIHKNFAMCAFNKSSIALKGLDVGACIIDSDYQGEISIHIRNISNNDIVIKPREKIIQFILMPVLLADVEVVPIEELYTEITERGEGGFGSTNKK